MSKNYDMIATVGIDIAQPIVDDTSFGNLLIVGPLPKKAAKKAPPKVGSYSSLSEVIEAGWVANGDNADPVGVAAQVAFAQSPAPSTIYIAPIQRTVPASVAAAASEINDILSTNIGRKDGLTGCTVSFGANDRILRLNLTGAISGVKNTGIFDALKSVSDKGYACYVNGGLIENVDDFKASEAFAAISALAEGDTPVQLLIAFQKEGVEINYGAVIANPGESGATAENTTYDFHDISIAETESEPATDTITRALNENGWYVVCPAGVDSSEYESIAALIETQEKMFVYTELDFFGDIENKAATGGVYYRTVGVYGRGASDQDDADIPAANRYINVAFAAKWLHYSSGSETSAHKRLSSVYPSALSTSEMNALKDAKLNYFVTVGSANVTMNGVTRAGEWADIIRFRDWLKNDMQVRVVNLFITNPKIPYTDSGIALIQNAMLASLKAGQDAGGIAEDEFDADGNVIAGYQTSVPLAASLSSSQKASRKLSNCKFKARLAGAIHFAEINGSLTYEL